MGKDITNIFDSNEEEIQTEYFSIRENVLHFDHITIIFRSGTKVAGTSTSSVLYAGSKALGTASSKIPIIGLAVDYGMQLNAGENATDALNKTIIHFGVGAIVGLALSATPVGVAIVGGAIVSTVINTAFDSTYDSLKKSKEK